MCRAAAERGVTRAIVLCVLACVSAASVAGCEGGPAIGASIPSPSDLRLDESSETAVLVGAGDIAVCGFVNAERTARLLDGIQGTVFTAGDNAYPDGTAQQFQECYEPTWGRHKHRTRPSPGNHDYNTAGAVPYYEYFGLRAGPPGRGYYAYNAGSWRIMSLNSNVPAHKGSPQFVWLKGELERVPARCRMAYWHHPVFSSGFGGNDPKMREIWRLLREHGVDIVVSGHSHNYERFTPQDADGAADPARGIREFVVGTGGAGLTAQGTRQPNSEAFDSTSMGVLKLTLRPGTYDWEFVPIPQHSYTDSGSSPCV